MTARSDVIADASQLRETMRAHFSLAVDTGRGLNTPDLYPTHAATLNDTGYTKARTLLQ